MNLPGLLLAPLRWLAGLVVPMFVRPAAAPALLWLLHFLLFAGLLVGLYFLQHRYQLAPQSVPSWLRQVALPALAVVLYALVWQAWWLSKLLGGDEAEASSFPDLDNAWGEALAALDKAGIDIYDVPVFLVLGRLDDREAEAQVFTGLPRSLLVKAAPAATAPLRIYGDREAVYILAPSASALRAGPSSAAPASFQGAMNSMGVDQSIGVGQSVGMDAAASIGVSAAATGPLARVQQIIKDAQRQNRPLTEQERQLIRDLSGAPAPSASGGALDSRKVDEQAARLGHVCRLLARTRWPVCPLNGVVLLVSANAGDADDTAQAAGLAGQRDLQTVRDFAELRCPTYVLVGDLDEQPGCTDFVERFPAERRTQRLGKGFPTQPDLPREQVFAAVEKTGRWVFQGLLGYWVAKLLRLESSSGRESPVQVATVNGRLFQFMTKAFDQGGRLGQVVARAVAPSDEEPHPFGGCYITALKGQPAFLAEFFKKVEHTQDNVAWTDAALAADAADSRKALMGYVVFALLVVAVAAFAAWVFWFRK